MKIVRESGINGDKRLRYNLTEGAGQSISEMIGQRLQIKAYVLIETENQDAETQRILKLLTEDGEIVGTSSGSFIAGFERFLDCMESDECTEMEIGQRTSKAGRKYLQFIA